MGVFLIAEDIVRRAEGLTLADAEEIVSDLEALATLEAPCLSDPTFANRDAVRAILRQAALRWHKAATGVVASDQMTSGPFSFMQTMDTRNTGEGQLWPAEVRKLRKLCRIHSGTTSGRKAFTVIPGRR